jgi:hypothetical protein
VIRVQGSYGTARRAILLRLQVIVARLLTHLHTCIDHPTLWSSFLSDSTIMHFIHSSLYYGTSPSTIATFTDYYLVSSVTRLDSATYCDDSRLLPTGELLHLGDLESDLDERLQSLLGIQTVLALVLAVPLDVQPDSSTGGSSTRQSEDDSGTVGELDVETLFRRDRSVNGVSVGEVVGVVDGEGRVRRGGFELAAGKAGFGKLLSEVVHHLLGSGRLDLFVVVSGNQ